MNYARFAAGREDSDHVETRGIESRLSLRQVLPGEGAYGGLLARGDGVERVSVACPPSQFDLNEDEGRSLAEDEIQLPVAGPVVALDQLVATVGQVPQREVLTPRAARTFAQGPTPA